MLCFEVTINDGRTVRAGHPEISVLTAIATYVASRSEVDYRLGGLIGRAKASRESADWVDQPLRAGDTVVLRVVDAEEANEPVSRRAEDPELVEKERRRYYERLKAEYEGKPG